MMLSDQFEIKPDCKRVILHVGRDISTGVWSLVMALAVKQNRIAGQMAGIGLLCSQSYPKAYLDELVGAGISFMTQAVPFKSWSVAFGMFILSNPLRGWIKQLAVKYPDVQFVVHFHNAWLAGGFFPLPKFKNVSYVSTFHGIAARHKLEQKKLLCAYHRFLAQRLVKNNVRLTSVSCEGTIAAETLFHIPRGKFSIIANGIPQDVELAAKIETADFIVGHVGQMCDGKGWQLAFQAVKQLRKEGVAIRMIAAGSGPDEQQAIALAKGNSFFEFRGNVPNAGAVLIPQLDCLVLASWSEGMPMAIVEAFRAGVPVLASKIGGLPEMIRPGMNGEFIERAVDSIVVALRKMIADREYYQKLAQGAHSFFEQNYAIEHVVSRYGELYEQNTEENR
jgi:glycosyltransferase involved in cell wall biosynthesis